MPLIQVAHLNKDFRVVKHQRGARGAVRNLVTSD
jgi:hypothetical protein